MVFAQAPKGSPTKAKAYMSKGDLANAKAEVEAYLDGEKFKKKPKSSGYLLQGEVYMAIAMSEKESDRALLDDPIGKTLEAFAKVKGMSKENDPEYKKIYNNQGIDPNTFLPKPSLVEEFRNFYFQQGASSYNDDEDYAAAMKHFEKCYRIMPEDTTAAFYAFSCASVDDDEKGMLRNLDKLYETKYPNDKPYTSVARMYFAKGIELEEDDKKEEAKAEYKKMLETANKGLEIVPTSGDLVKFQIESFIRLGQADEAIKLLNQSVKDNPQDSLSFFSLGALYEKQKNYDDAEKNYMAALKLAPNYYSANINVAAFYIERAKDTKRQMEDLVGPTGDYTDKAKADKLSAERKGFLTNALKYLEKCDELQPGEGEITENISTIKALLKRND